MLFEKFLLRFNYIITRQWNYSDMRLFIRGSYNRILIFRDEFAYRYRENPVLNTLENYKTAIKSLLYALIAGSHQENNAICTLLDNSF